MKTNEYIMIDDIYTHIQFVDIQCTYCGDFYTTHQMINDGSIQEYCCSNECYKRYHSIEMKRERIIKNILNEDK